MNVTPIKQGIVNFRKSELLNGRLLLGIDTGFSLTKVIFLHKDRKTDFVDDKSEFVILNHALFKSEDFVEAMKWTKENVYMPDGWTDNIHVTGRDDINKRNIVESIFGNKTVYVDNLLSTIAGHRISMENIGLEQLIASPVEVTSHGKIDSKFIEKFTESFVAKFAKDKLEGDRNGTKIFPCLVNAHNSESEYYYFDEEGRGAPMNYPLQGGKTFLGLAKCLLDTNSYEDVVKLALIGDRANVDTQVKDFLNDDPNSPYGRFPPEMPIFSFGKGMDTNYGLEHFKKEDVAMSLVGFYCIIMIMQAAQMCLLKKIPKIYLTGNLFRSDVFQREITRAISVFPFGVQFEILDIGYCGALGVMLCDDRDKDKYCITPL